MKRIILFLILITQFAFSQVNTTTTTVGRLKMNIPDPGAKKDSVVVWDGTTKLLKFRPASQITGTTNLDQLVSPTGISIFSSTGTDIVLPLATSTNSGLFAPAEKAKLAGIASGATANDTDLNLKNRANHTGTQAIATVTGLQTALDGKENLSAKGIASGYAGLDASGKVPLTQINDALLGSVNYQGTYNAAANSPALPTVSTANKGFYYVVSAAGTQAGLTLNAGDWIISNGTAWGKIDNNNAVTAVNGATGNVTLSTSNIAEGTNLYYTDARVNANASVAASAASRHNALTLGTANGLSLSTQALSLGLASTSTTGALSSTDWNSFNNKQAAISGTANYLTKFGSGGVVQSALQEGSDGNTFIGAGSSTSIGFSVNKEVAELNKHSFEDYSFLNPISPGWGYGVFDASTAMGGAVNNDHLISYQARTNYASSGNLGMLNNISNVNSNSGMFGFFTAMNHNSSGTINNCAGILVNDVYGSGTISNNYGIYIRPISRGILNSWSIFSEKGKNFLGGDTFIVNNNAIEGNSNVALNFGVDSSATITNFSAQIKALQTNGYATSMLFSTYDGNNRNVRMKLTHDGKLLVNKTADDLTNVIQADGTISALAGTQPNQVVVKSQLDAAIVGAAWTPTYTNGTNVTAVSNYGANSNTYSVIGDLVTVNFSCQITQTTPNNLSEFTINLPVSVGTDNACSALVNCFSVTGPTMTTGFLNGSSPSSVLVKLKHANNTSVIVRGTITYLK